MNGLRRTACGLPFDIGFVVCAVFWLNLLDLQPTPAYSIQSRSRFLRSAILHPQVALVASSEWVAAASDASARNLPDPVTLSSNVASGSTEALQPILQLRRDLQQLAQEVQGSSRQADDTLSVLLDSLPKTETAFKAVFDRYSDPVSYKQKFVDQNAFLVYYTKGFDGPGRPSIESDLPVKQTLQYGLRNECWIAYESFRSELEYQKRHPEDYSVEDLTKPLTETVKTISSYIDVSLDPTIMRSK